MKYTAYLTGNRRGISTMYPKALLINIEPNGELDRDHCWIEMNTEVSKLQPAGHKKPIKVEIEAELKQYKKRGISDSFTLQIKSIKRIS